MEEIRAITMNKKFKNEKGVIRDAALYGCEISGCRLDNCKLESCVVSGCTITDVLLGFNSTFIKCTADNATVERMYGCTIECCNGTATVDGFIDNTKIVNSDICVYETNDANIEYRSLVFLNGSEEDESYMLEYSGDVKHPEVQNS